MHRHTCKQHIYTHKVKVKKKNLKGLSGAVENTLDRDLFDGESEDSINSLSEIIQAKQFVNIAQPEKLLKFISLAVSYLNWSGAYVAPYYIESPRLHETLSPIQ